jgi:hypothetical protein
MLQINRNYYHLATGYLNPHVRGLLTWGSELKRLLVFFWNIWPGRLFFNSDAWLVKVSCSRKLPEKICDEVIYTIYDAIF